MEQSASVADIASPPIDIPAGTEDVTTIPVDSRDENITALPDASDTAVLSIEYPDGTSTGSITEALAVLNDNAASNEEEIKTLITKAEEALKKYRLTSPKTDNAYYYYNKILKLDPGNKDAKKGLRKLAGKYGTLADKALKKDDEEKARTYLQRGLRIQPNDKSLQQKIAYLDELQAARLAPPPPEPVAPPPKPEPEPVNTSLELLESLE
jgi:tetratricopeptide (TPR) repeat protein